MCECCCCCWSAVWIYMIFAAHYRKLFGFVVWRATQCVYRFISSTKLIVSVWVWVCTHTYIYTYTHIHIHFVFRLSMIENNQKWMETNLRDWETRVLALIWTTLYYVYKTLYIIISQLICAIVPWKWPAVISIKQMSGGKKIILLFLRHTNRQSIALYTELDRKERHDDDDDDYAAADNNNNTYMWRQPTLYWMNFDHLNIHDWTQIILHMWHLSIRTWQNWITPLWHVWKTVCFVYMCGSFLSFVCVGNISFGGRR